MLQKVYIEGLPEAGVVNLVINEREGRRLRVTFEDINNTISTKISSNYINDFPNRGRMQRVVGAGPMKTHDDRGHPRLKL